MAEDKGTTKRRDVGTAPGLAKIARPVLASVYPRSRLFRMLDRARKRCPVVWIAAPAGAGKTTLVASYLQARRLPVLWYRVDASDNDVASFFYYLGLAAKRAAPRRRPLPLLTGEYLAGLPTFAANYFRELFGRLRRSTVIVLDNYQDAAADGKLQHLLQNGLAEIPAGVNVIVISRVEPPPAYARLRASDRIALLGWDDIKLTEREGAEIVRLRGRQKALSPKAFRHLYQTTRGWVAGLVLLTEHPVRDSLEPIAVDANGSQAVFDYFASEIFHKGERSVQEFLLKTAFLPRISVAVTQSLTGRRNSEAILGHLTRRNLFTVRHADDSYEYHPLFRAFLIQRARATLGADDVREIQKRSALLLAEGGDVEGAVDLLQQAADWTEAVRLIRECAPALLAQGRSQMLHTWLQSFPEDFRAANPWLLYWYGMSQMAFAPADARPSFERAYALFEKGSDATALCRAWCGVVESYLLERNDFTRMLPWLDLYPAIVRNNTSLDPDVEIATLFTYISGRMNSSFDHPDLPACAERAAQLIRRETSGNRWLREVVTLIPYYLWKGEIAKTRELLDSLSSQARAPDASPLMALSWFVWKSWHSVPFTPEESLQAAMDGLALAERSGVHLFDLTLHGCAAWERVCAGDLSRARELVDRMPRLIGRGRVNSAFYRHLAAIVYLQEGDLTRALEEARLSAEQTREGGNYVGVMSFFICLAFVHAARGELEAASRALAEGRARVVRIDGKVHRYFADLCEASIERRRGSNERALAALGNALALAREMGAIIPAYCPRDEAARLFAMALDAGMHTDFVRNVIQRTHLSPPEGMVCEHWPWPVRIYTMGRFSLIKDGKPLAFGRARQKPLELLRALISFGGRDVSVGRVTQLLWPDTEGDMARRVMETTLHRLRRMIGEECIVRHDNQLSLSPEHCWLDIREFEQLIETIEGAPTASRAQRLLDLYRGPFSGEDDTPAALVQRERLRAKFLRAMAQLGQRLEADGDCQTAVSCYEKAIDVEPLAEDLYLRLMRCYRRLNRPTEALAVYRRCNKTLTSVLQIEPNQETRTLYMEIQQSTS